LFKVSDGRNGTEPTVVQDRNSLTLHEGEKIALRVTNRSKEVSVFVTILFVSSDFTISCVYPRGDEPREALAAGTDFTTPRTRVNAETVGLEHFVVIAEAARERPTDFGWLTQPTLAQAQDVTTRGEHDPLESPLGRLLRHALYAEGQTRCLDRAIAASYTLRLLSWQTTPRPASPKGPR
jgi:hypothetical protein